MHYLAIFAVAAGGPSDRSVVPTLELVFCKSFYRLCKSLDRPFLWGTFTIKITDAFIIGVILQLAAGQPDFSPYLRLSVHLRLFVATVILGGYTTSSTFAYESYALGSNRLLEALLHVAESVIRGIASATPQGFALRGCREPVLFPAAWTSTARAL